MDSTPKNFELARLVFGLLIMAVLIIACFWVVQPFILGFSWACMAVIATWGLMLRIQKLLWNKRILAVCVMMLLLLLVFILPFSLIISNIVKNSSPLIEWMKDSANWQLPSLEWLKTIPSVGSDLYLSWNQMIANDGVMLIEKIKPYAGQSASWLILQAISLGHFIFHGFLMLAFSGLLYYKGEHIGLVVNQFAMRIAPQRGAEAITLAAQAIRAVALGIVVTAFIQAILGGLGLLLAGINYTALLIILMFICCLAQLGPLLIMIPSVAWLYWNGDSTVATILLIWSLGVATMDGFLRPALIRKGANLPFILTLTGVIGGLLAFGMIGLFIGPVVLAVSFRLLSAWIEGEAVVKTNHKHNKGVKNKS